MFSVAKFTEIYCLVNDFCKEFAKYQENHIMASTLLRELNENT